MDLFRTIWYRWLRQPHRLVKQIDEGAGQPVVLLHGIGSSSRFWKSLVERLKSEYRVIAFDLLGFGVSPKPDWIDYTIDDHARAVVASLRAQRFSRPVVLIGHSMGALVALRVARLEPSLVRHVILYEMPLYEGLPEKRHYKARLALYFRFYEWVLKQQPTYGEAKQRFRERVATRVSGLQLTPETWQPFMRSLKNSIMTQTAASDIKHLRMNADVIYGSRDMVVIRGKVATIFGTDATHLTGHTVRAGHGLTPKAMRLITDRLAVAVQGDTQ